MSRFGGWTEIRFNTAQHTVGKVANLVEVRVGTIKGRDLGLLGILAIYQETIRAAGVELEKGLFKARLVACYKGDARVGPVKGCTNL